MSKVELWKDTQYSLVGMYKWELALPDQPTDTDTNTRLPSLKPIQCGTVESTSYMIMHTALHMNLFAGQFFYNIFR